MSVRDRLVPPIARALFALPPRVIAVLAGSPPPHAAGLEPDAWLVARLAAHQAIPAGSASAAERGGHGEGGVGAVAIRPGLPLSTRDVALDGPAGPLAARLYVPAGAPAPG